MYTAIYDAIFLRAATCAIKYSDETVILYSLSRIYKTILVRELKCALFLRAFLLSTLVFRGLISMELDFVLQLLYSTPALTMRQVSFSATYHVFPSHLDERVSLAIMVSSIVLGSVILPLAIFSVFSSKTSDLITSPHSMSH